MLTRRAVKRWKAPAILLLMVVLLWMAFFASDKRSGSSSSSSQVDTFKQDSRLPANKLEWKLAPEDKIVDVAEARPGEFLGDELNLPPLARRGPMPVVYDLAEDNQHPNEEENAALEEVDGVKEPENGRVDDNAAREEHSGEAVIPGIGNAHVSMKQTGRKKEVPELRELPSDKLRVGVTKTSEKVVKVAEEIREQEDSFHQLPEHQKDLPEVVPNISQEIPQIEEIREPEDSFNQLLELEKDHPEDKYDSYNNVVLSNQSEKIPQVAEKIREEEESFHQLPEHQKDLPEDKFDSYNNWRNLTVDDISKLSVMGRRMFLNEKIGQEQNRTYTIHVWKYIKNIEKRLLKGYGKDTTDLFDGCSVSNCKVTSDDRQVTEADAVLFHLHRIDVPPASVPRKQGQLWVWLSDESPYNVFMMAKDRQLSHYSGYFNWSMTYRIDSDVPVPYGRTVPLPKDRYLEKIDDVFSMKAKDIAILGSNCGGRNGRYKYITELQKYIPVDIYGGCGPLKCEGHFWKDCPALEQYKFYLAFENSNCDDYITEKVWWNALGKGAVPVVMGASKNNYLKLLPPGSFIFAENFPTPKHLAEYLKFLLQNPKLYQEYHSWRRRYRVLNEHGYFQSRVYHFCRLCEALNYNSRPREGATADLLPFFDSSQHCYPATWKPS